MSTVKYFNRQGDETTPERAFYASVNGVCSDLRQFGGPGSGPHPGGGKGEQADREHSKWAVGIGTRDSKDAERATTKAERTGKAQDHLQAANAHKSAAGSWASAQRGAGKADSEEYRSRTRDHNEKSREHIKAAEAAGAKREGDYLVHGSSSVYLLH